MGHCTIQQVQTAVEAWIIVPYLKSLPVYASITGGTSAAILYDMQLHNLSSLCDVCLHELLVKLRAQSCYMCTIQLYIENIHMSACCSSVTSRHAQH